MILACTRHSHRRVVGEKPGRITWTAQARKAASDAPSPPEDGQDWLLEIADKAQPAVRAAFLEALKKVRDGIKEAELQDAITRGDVPAAMRALGLDADLRDALQPMIRPLEDNFIAGGREAIPRTFGATVGLRFDLTNPNTATFLRNYDFGLIRQISDDTREGIRTIITDAFKQGGHPYEQARQIRASIGLTDNQAQAVVNFRRLLQTRDRRALDRELRDRRYDPTLHASLGSTPTRDISPEQITRMVDRYRSRYINARAVNIARTETIRASNAAQHMAWGQAADKGLLDRTATRVFWLVTPDDRLCDFCAEVPDLNQDGVALGGYFQSDLGPVMFPPLHPQCRCVTYIGRAGTNG